MSREELSSWDRSAIRIDTPNDHLQVLRFVHALSESDYPVCVTAEMLSKMAYLKQYFGAKLYKSLGHEHLITDFEIIHEKPSTRLGAIERPLIFPHAYFSYLRQLWQSNRDVEFSFTGLMTPMRIDSLNEWLRRQGISNRIPRPPFLKTYLALRERLRARLKVRSPGAKRMTFHTKYGCMTIGASDRGRVFPGKAWDDDYFRMLARSKFVLCPAGDFVWTYRFFEGIMCGAIPIVEASCSSYDGFRYFKMEDSIADLQWSSDIAEHNVMVCSRLLTIPREQLNEEISRMFSKLDLKPADATSEALEAPNLYARSGWSDSTVRAV